MAKKLNLGCGNNKLDGFINIDKYDAEADMIADVCELPFENESVDEIVAYQVIEHLPYWKTQVVDKDNGFPCQPTFFEECHRVLVPGGTLITECPDIEFIARRIAESGEVDYINMINLYGEYWRPWDATRYPDWEHQAGSLHINAFTWKNIQNIAKRVGFKVHRNPMTDKHVNYRYPENLSVLWTKL